MSLPDMAAPAAYLRAKAPSLSYSFDGGKENGFRGAVGQNTGLCGLLIEIVREYTPGPSNRKEDRASALSS